MKRFIGMAAAAVLTAALWAAASETDGMTALFDGHSTNGWVLRGGQAEFRIGNGCLVGRTVQGQANSFLRLPKKCGDLEIQDRSEAPFRRTEPKPVFRSANDG